MTEDNVDKEALPTKDVAEVGAYAEKPFRDMEIKYREQLGEEGRKALEMIAGKEGEEAMKAYQEKKSLEDPRIDALRTLISETAQLNPVLEVDISRRGKDYLERTKNLLKRFSKNLLDRVIADEKFDFAAKKERLTHIGFFMDRGAAEAFNGINHSRIIEEYKTATKENLADILRGHCAVAMAAGSIDGVCDIAKIGEIEGQGATKTIQEYMPIFVELRKSPQYAKSLGPNALGLDKAMMGEGFLWSPASESYIHMSGAATPGAETGG